MQTPRNLQLQLWQHLRVGDKPHHVNAHRERELACLHFLRSFCTPSICNCQNKECLPESTHSTSWDIRISCSDSLCGASLTSQLHQPPPTKFDLKFISSISLKQHHTHSIYTLLSRGSCGLLAILGLKALGLRSRVDSMASRLAGSLSTLLKQFKQLQPSQ